MDLKEKLGLDFNATKKIPRLLFISWLQNLVKVCTIFIQSFYFALHWWNSKEKKCSLVSVCWDFSRLKERIETKLSHNKKILRCEIMWAFCVDSWHNSEISKQLCALLTYIDICLGEWYLWIWVWNNNNSLYPFPSNLEKWGRREEICEPLWDFIFHRN